MTVNAVSTPTEVNPLVLRRYLEDAYRRYYASECAAADDAVAREQVSLLHEGQLSADVILEPVPGFSSSEETLSQVAARLGLNSEVAQFFRPLLGDRQLYTHQVEALEQHLSGQHVLLASGTGSGKTEALLLPVMLHLLAESQSWSAQTSQPAAWWRDSTRYVPQRRDETGHPPGMRSLILYPMNALVEDQMGRLRRLLNSPTQLQWLDRHRQGHRFYFGRYTSQTPSERSVLSALRDLDQRSRGVIEAQSADHDAVIAHIPRPLGAEMLTRPDMCHAAPDILITNYSMLNVMLTRPEEDSIFAQTAAYLRSPAARFYLLVDELHTYSGTAGTEVALLIRRLCHRLELEPGSPQLCILAASASLGEDPAQATAFAKEFFGPDRAKFALVEGHQSDWPQPSGQLPEPTAIAMAQVGRRLLDAGPLSRPPLEQAGSELVGLRAHLLSACNQARSGALPTSASTVAERLFPKLDPADRESALTGALEYLGSASEGERLPIRAHLFFRTLAGWWACTDPGCSALSGRFRHEERRLGKLYLEPRIRCDCGARCLDLWICQTCGESLLGGYRSIPDQNSPDEYLVPEFPDLEGSPDTWITRRSLDNYRILWPVAGSGEPVDLQWAREGVIFQWLPCHFESASGRVGPPQAVEPNAWVFSASSSGTLLSSIPPLPVQCPKCGDDWEAGPRFVNGHQLRDPITSPRRTRSPLRRATVAASRAVQLLNEHLLRTIYAPGSAPKAVVFSDSRQEAARLAADIDLAHHRDAVRQVVAEVAMSAPARSEGLLGLADRLERGAPVASSDWDALVVARDSEAIRTLRLAFAPGVSASEQLALTRLLAELRQRIVPLVEVRDEVWTRLLGVGRNPAGPSWTGQGFWGDLFDWSQGNPTPASGMNSEVEALRASLWRELGRSLFAASGHDIESLGLAVLTPRQGDVSPPVGWPPEHAQSLVEGCLRVLALSGRYNDNRQVTSSGQRAPAELRRWLGQAARRQASDPVELERWAEDQLNRSQGPCQSWLVRLERLALRPAGLQVWECSRCHYQHRQPSAQTCVHCQAPLTAPPFDSAPGTDDYYVWMAKAGYPITRLATEELTAQTAREDALKRQVHFQEVFLEGEPAAPSGVDILSVTTTMEVGVDIGSLQAVTMANMPPRRANYQQRAGRAGRSGTALAVVLTVARNRAHDEYYFSHAEEMTAAPSPPPYLCTSQATILQRMLRHEALRLGFASLPTAVSPELGTNVHGHFGLAQDWERWAPKVETALASARPELESFCDALLKGTKCDESRDQLMEVVRDLPQRVSVLAAMAGEHPDLSQRLAEHGLLPMFGFPTQVRSLYTTEPRHSQPWPPKGAVDRELRLAISEFAPGNEIILDKRVYRSTGCVALIPQRQGPPRYDEEAALGITRELSVCNACDSVSEQSPGPCANCDAPETSLRSMLVASPAGFRANWKERAPAYEGLVERQSSAAGARIQARRPGAFTPFRVLGFSVQAGSARLYYLNENGHRGFTFDRDPSGRGLIVTSPLSSGQRPAHASDARVVSLGAAVMSDVLLIGPSWPQPPGWSHFMPVLTPLDRLVSTARRAGWLSLAYTLRNAAAILFDVARDEIETGVHLRRHESGQLFPEVFLADTLANGAGYMNQFQDTAVFAALLDSARRLVSGWDQVEDHDCDTSCHRCLRDYSNAPLHPVLDWRLGADLLSLLTDGNISRDRWRANRERAAAAAVASFPDWSGWEWSPEGQVVHTVRGDLVVVHPADDLPYPWAIHKVDIFNLYRRPGFIYLRAL